MSTGIKKEPTPAPAVVGTVTCREGQAALISLVESVLLYTPGSQVHTSLVYEGADTIIDFLNVSAQDLDGFEVKEDTPLPKQDKTKLKIYLNGSNISTPRICLQIGRI